MTHGRNGNLLTLFLKTIILSAALALFAYGCASVPIENAALINAKAAYEKAQGDPKVAANASVPLYEAGQSLKAAEMAKSETEKSHLAYLAERQTAIALAMAEQKLAEVEREKLAREKDQILLEQRERQARDARGEARSMAQEAEKQRIAAEQRTREAEAALKLAESRKLEIEKAAREAEMRTAELEKVRKEAEMRAAEVLEARKREEAATAQAKEREREISELKAKKTDRGFVLTLGDVLFSTGKADVMSGAQRTIDQLSAFLNKYPATKVLVEGHTDSVGNDAYNMTLSQQRAEAVRSAIMARGISSDRITTKGLGELYPVASNDDPAGRQQNRRIEIVILFDEQTPAQKKE